MRKFDYKAKIDKQQEFEDEIVFEYLLSNKTPCELAKQFGLSKKKVILILKLNLNVLTH